MFFLIWLEDVESGSRNTNLVAIWPAWLSLPMEDSNYLVEVLLSFRIFPKSFTHSRDLSCGKNTRNRRYLWATRVQFSCLQGCLRLLAFSRWCHPLVGGDLNHLLGGRLYGLRVGWCFDHVPAILSFQVKLRWGHQYIHRWSLGRMVLEQIVNKLLQMEHLPDSSRWDFQIWGVGENEPRMGPMFHPA